jgi:uncharacterized protein (UPF0303 family)
MTEDFAAVVAEIEEQEARLQFTRFTHEDALTLGLLIVRLATERSLGVTVDITRGDQQVFHVALAGTTADNDDWVARKVRTVRRFGTSSYLAHGGSFPIAIRDAGPIGTVTVSGLPQADDHALVVEALELFLGAH